MMKQTKTCLLLVAVLFTVSFAKAQTAEEVIAKCIDAMGGKDKISQVSSLYTEGTIEVMGGSNPNTVTILNGKGYKSEVDFNGAKIVRCASDKSGWMINPMMGAETAQPMTDDDYNAEKETIFIGAPLYGYADRGGKAELQGNEKLGDVNAIKLKLTTATGVEYTLYIDPTTYFLLKSDRDAGGNITSSIFSDYRKTDFGIVIPFASQITVPQGFTLNATVSKVEVNKTIDPAIFDMPK